MITDFFNWATPLENCLYSSPNSWRNEELKAIYALFFNENHLRLANFVSYWVCNNVLAIWMCYALQITKRTLRIIASSKYIAHAEPFLKSCIWKIKDMFLVYGIFVLILKMHFWTISVPCSCTITVYVTSKPESPSVWCMQCLATSHFRLSISIFCWYYWEGTNSKYKCFYKSYKACHSGIILSWSHRRWKLVLYVPSLLISENTLVIRDYISMH